MVLQDYVKATGRRCHHMEEGVHVHAIGRLDMLLPIHVRRVEDSTPCGRRGFQCRLPAVHRVQHDGRRVHEDRDSSRDVRNDGGMPWLPSGGKFLEAGVEEGPRLGRQRISLPDDLPDGMVQATPHQAFAKADFK